MEAKVEIQATVMAIRETLMEYYKGTCVERLTVNSTVGLAFMSNGNRRDFQYLRRQAENQKLAVVTLGGLPIMTVQRFPDRAVFNEKILTRSPQLTDVYDGVRGFMEKYLRGVEVDHNKKGVLYAN